LERVSQGRQAEELAKTMKLKFDREDKRKENDAAGQIAGPPSSEQPLKRQSSSAYSKDVTQKDLACPPPPEARAFVARTKRWSVGLEHELHTELLNLTTAEPRSVSSTEFMTWNQTLERYQRECRIFSRSNRNRLHPSRRKQRNSWKKHARLTLGTLTT